MLSGSNDRTVRIWRLLLNESQVVETGHSEGVSSVAFSTDNTLFATGSYDKSVRIWRVSDCICIQELLGHTGPVRSLEFVPKSNLLASASEDDTIRLWAWSDGECQTIIADVDDGARALRVSDDGKYLVSSSSDGAVRILDLENPDDVHVLDDEHFQSAVFVPSETAKDRRVATCSRSSPNVHIWTLSSTSDVSVASLQVWEEVEQYSFHAVWNSMI
jgi:WD40 repeat protein